VTVRGVIRRTTGGVYMGLAMQWKAAQKDLVR